MKKFLLLLYRVIFIIAFFHSAAKAQTIRIVDGMTGKPLELVNVLSFNPEMLSISNPNGEVDISEFTGFDSIQISRLGFLRKWYTYQELTMYVSSPLKLDSLSFPLDTFIISSTRWRQSRRDVPNRIVSISPDDIAIDNAQTAADVLQGSGEVFVQKSQLGGGSPMIRGFSANRVLLTVDGVRMNNAIFRSGNVQNVISIDPQSVNRVEVNYGPGSVIYGSDALGGVLSYFTKGPKIYTTDSQAVSGSALARTSTANQERTGHIEINFDGGKWASLSSITFSAYDDLLMGSNGPSEYLRPEFIVARPEGDTLLLSNNDRKQIYSGYEQINLMQKILFQPNKSLKVKYGGHFAKTSNIPRYDRLIEYEADSLKYAEWYYGPQQWTMHNLSIEHSGDSNLYDGLNLTLAYQEFKESRHSRLFNDTQRLNQHENLHAVSLNLDLTKRLNKKQNLYYGLEGVGNWVGSTATLLNVNDDSKAATQTRYPDGSEWYSAALYAAHQWRFSREWTMQTGIRANYILANGTLDTTYIKLPLSLLQNSNAAANGSIGIAYKPSSTWQINFNASTGFRAPNIDDLAKVFDSEPGAVVLPNTTLKPEHAYNIDFGILKVIDDVLKIDVTGFYTILENAMVRRNSTFDGADSILYQGDLSRVQTIQNASSAFVYGFHAGYELKIGRHWSSVARYNYQIGQEQLADGSWESLRHVAPSFGMFNVSYKRKKLQIIAYAQANGKISNSMLAPSERNKPHLYANDQNGVPYSPSWYTLNLKAQFQITTDLLISSGVENILDERYRPYSSGIAAPGRNYLLSLRANF